jgi:hypothetical protein
MNSLNDEVCEFNSTPVTENFSGICESGANPDDKCPSGCRSVGQGTCVPSIKKFIYKVINKII